MTIVASYGASAFSTGLAIYAGFDFARLGTFTLNFHDTADRVVTFDMNSSPSQFAHRDMSTVLGTGRYDDFATALGAAMTTASAAHTYTVSWDASLLQYTIAVTPGVFDILATTNTLAKNLLGFPSLPTSVGSSATSQARPYYVIAGVRGARSKVSDDYEPDDAAHDAEADDGTAYGIARLTLPVYHDFVVPTEPREAVLKRAALSAAPWTWQHLFEHARNIEPLLVEDTEEMIGYLLADAAHWRPKPQREDYHGFWDVPFRMRVTGRL